MDNFFDKSFWQNIVAEVALLAAIWLLKRAAVRIYPRTRRLWNHVYLIVIFVVLVSSNLWYLKIHGSSAGAFSAISTSICFAIIWRELNQFWSIGLVGGDTEVRKGLNYDKALKLCTNGFDFLGVGAAKLTASSQFEAAIQRCHRQNAPMRFLLLNPTNNVLRHAAERKGDAAGEYRRKVEESLRILAQLREQKHVNIEVRFHVEQAEPLFRLMFVNDQLCLVSYYVFGEGDGSQLPQMYIQRFEYQRDTDSFYYPFRTYFERLWAQSPNWDYQFPIQ